MWKAWRISRACRARPGAAAIAGGGARRSRSCARAPFVEYERVAALKLRFLKLLFVQFLREWRAGSARAREFEAFREREGDLLEKFATYCALDEHLHRRNPGAVDLAAVAGGISGPRFGRDARVPQETLARGDVLPVPAVADRPAVAPRAAAGARPAACPSACITTWRWPPTGSAPTCGRTGRSSWRAAAWARRPTISRPRARTGAFRRPTPNRHREDGYRLFAESIRKNCRHGGALRIDHVMRLFRLYWIPDGCDASAGRLRAGSARTIWCASWRSKACATGWWWWARTWAPWSRQIRETLARFGILSYRLFYFEKNQRGEFRRNDEYPRQALVSSTTHDLPTLAGFWVGADIEARRAAGVLEPARLRRAERRRAPGKAEDAGCAVRSWACCRRTCRAQAAAYPELTGELHNAIVGFLALTPSQLLAINQEDLTKETGAAEPARHHLAVSQLGPQDALHAGRAADQ